MYFDEEYRVYNERIGQGHYCLTPQDAINEAKKLSKRFPDDIIKIDQFKPKPVETLETYKNGEVQTFKA